MIGLARLGTLALRYGRTALIGLGLIKVGNDLDPTDEPDQEESAKVGGAWLIFGVVIAVLSAIVTRKITKK